MADDRKHVQLLHEEDPGIWYARVPFSRVDWTEHPWKREVKDGRVGNIASKFDADCAEIPTVCEIDGRIVAIEGNHRTKARMRMGQWAFYARHVGTKTHAEAAAIMNHIAGGRVGLGSWERWRSALVAGFEEETLIDSLVRDVGGEVTREKRRGISAVARIIGIYQYGGPLLLRRTLCAIRDAWPEHNLTGAAVEAPVLGAVAYAFGMLGDDLDRRMLVRALASVTPQQLERMAIAAGEERAVVGKPESARYYAVMDLYRETLAPKARSALRVPRPDWRLVQWRDDVAPSSAGAA